MKKQTKKVITEFILSKIKRDFRELIQYYPFSQLAFVSDKEIHFEVYAINKKEIKQFKLSKSIVENEKFSKRIYLVVNSDYCYEGPAVYSMEKWPQLDKIPYENKHFYNFKNYFYKNGFLYDYYPHFRKGRGFLTCTSVSKANKAMHNPLLENVKSAEMMLTSYELFLKGINDTIVLRQYKHGDEGVRQYDDEKRERRKV